jgi:uncharacterized membrane protein YhaH (DUF805 family)
MSKPVFEGLFALRGRRNRQSYFLYALALAAVAAGTVLAAGVASGAGETAGAIALLAAVPVWIAIGVSGWIVGAQRRRDFEWTGWATLLVLIPILGFFFSLAMFFIPGTDGPNRYGPDPIGGGETTSGRMAA